MNVLYEQARSTEAGKLRGEESYYIGLWRFGVLV
jgi:hypothetical protein